MLTRRTLFTRLSALALAPLVKWLPKEEPRKLSREEMLAMLRRARQRMLEDMYAGLDKYYWAPVSPPTSHAVLNHHIENLLRKQVAQAKPIPQEEA